MPDTLGYRYCRRWAVRGVTLIELSLVVSALLFIFTLDLQSRREDRLFSFANRAAAELREIVEGAMIYRTHRGVWPLDICVEEVFVPPSNPLSDDCNGDGELDTNDISGVRRLFREGYIPLTDWRTELSYPESDFSGDNRALSINSVLGGRLLLQPVPTTGTDSWKVASTEDAVAYAALAGAINSEDDIADFVSQQGLRLYMELPPPFACLANYIAALVPSARVVNVGVLNTNSDCTTLDNIGVEVLRRNEVHTASELALLDPAGLSTLSLTTPLRASLLVIGGNVRIDSPGDRIFLSDDAIYSPYYGVVRIAPYGINKAQASVVETALQFARLAADPQEPSAGLAVLAARPGERQQHLDCCVEHYRTAVGTTGTDYFPYGATPYSAEQRDWQNNVLIMRPGARIGLATTAALTAASSSSVAMALELWDYLRQYSTSIEAGQRESGQSQGLSYSGSHQVSGQVSGFAFTGSRDISDTDNLVVGGLPSGASSGQRERSALDLYNDPVVSLGSKTALLYDHVYVEELALLDVDFILAHGSRNWPWEPLGYRYASDPYQTSLGPAPGWERSAVDFRWPTALTLHNQLRLLSPDVSHDGGGAALTADLLNMAQDNSGGNTLSTIVIGASTVDMLSCMQCVGALCPTDPTTVADPC